MIVTTMIFTILNFLALMGIWGGINRVNELKEKEMEIFTGREAKPNGN